MKKAAFNVQAKLQVDLNLKKTQAGQQSLGRVLGREGKMPGQVISPDFPLE